MKKIYCLLLVVFLSENAFSQKKNALIERENLWNILIGLKFVINDSFSINIDKYISKTRCMCYLGAREYQELRNDTLLIPLMGYQILDDYLPKIFDICNLHKCDIKYFKDTYAYKDVYNIFFAEVQNKKYLIGLFFYKKRWHVNAYSPYAPFFWKTGTRVNY